MDKFISTPVVTEAPDIDNDENLCAFNLEKYQLRKHNKLSDKRKNDIISIEDDIYNLAFRPARRFGQHLFRAPRDMSINQSRNDKPEKIDLSRIYDYYNMSKHLVKLVGQDLLAESNEDLPVILTSNDTRHIKIFNLTSFGRYIVSIVACQNFTENLIDYATNHSPEHLRFFPIRKYCSKASLLTLRSLPDKSLDQVKEASLESDSGISFFKWMIPLNPNGQIYKYNLKFIDVNINKTHGPLCYSDLSNLKVPLNQFLLTEGHEYTIKVQAVSSAGPGLWSLPTVVYKVPNASLKQLILIFEIVGSIMAMILLILTVSIAARNFAKSKERGYFGINSNYYYFRPDEWEIKREDVLIEDRIGSGCFAEVHRGKINNKDGEQIDCAIKFCGSDNQNRQRLLKEANMMKSINTTHIVKLLGIVSVDNPAYLILEFMDKGDLKDYLKNSRTDPETRSLLTETRFKRIAAEIADGMLWLSQHKYIHRDLAARNCLISNNDVIKIADLGLSKDIYQNPVYREKCKSLLPIRWMSPESLLDGSSTTKSDIWSYGVVLYEVNLKFLSFGSIY